MHLTFKHPLAAVVLLGAVSAAQAAAVSPTFESFGTLAGATFNGSGIPNTAVAISSDGDRVVLGLTAHQRFVGPNLANNGAGVFSANAGVSAQPPSSPADPYALWNFAYYIGGTGTSSLIFELLYDFAPAAGTDASAHGVITIPGTFLNATLAQNSWNLGMNFLATNAPGLVAPGGAFDPTAAGQYTFQLTARTVAGDVLEKTAIQVNVNGVPEPGSLMLAGLALAGLATFGRRKA